MLVFYNYVEVQHPVNQFFEGINGTGRYFSLNSGDSTAHLNFSDNTSSVRVAPRTLVILYEHINFHGDVKILENRSNISLLFNIHDDFNDRASSIKTYRIC
ncbi:peptidase inhibitor family I36 protein [Brevibacillus laterosporus]|uniref:peptidase inhibitor family I36 protein n=1 Tax=Brevibacillus TaxID=55080 RepID=UPI0034D97189